jgi:serine/threonine-protein kinase
VEQDWDKLEELFHAVVDMTPEERAGYLDTNCKDETLRDELEALVEADSGTGNTISSAISGVIDAPIPNTIDNYKILELIGRGGMGAVYLAEREDFKKRVALKLMRGPATPDLILRFKAERQILARLEHGNIAKLLDGGATEHGEPYVVMEYVDGQPIDAYSRSLSIDGRLRLMEKVCDAVQYAHRGLVVHRDLKPANILVDKRGEPKLLDFGIAKLLDSGTAEFTLAETSPQQRLLTPHYASPEQVLGEPITTASDVYALGVVLYEMLSGTRPYEINSTSARVLERTICELDPPRPSQAAGDTRIARRLRGDLDTIVMMALRKEPERRYESAAQLGEDLERFRTGQTVRARPATLGYRASKFVRRNRWPVSAAALLLGALVAFAVITSRKNREIAAERDTATRERDAAQRVAELLISIFDASDPKEARGGSTTARALLDRSVDRVRDELANDAGMRGRLLHVLGRIYWNLGEIDRAEEILREALADRRAAHGERSLETVEVLRRLARIHLDRGDLVEAEQYNRIAYEVRLAELGPDHDDTIESHSNLASVYTNRGDLKTGGRIYKEVLDRRRARGDTGEELATAIHNYATVLTTAGQHEQALELIEEGMAELVAKMGADHPKVAMFHITKALVLMRLNRLQDADAEVIKGIALGEKVWGETDMRVADGYLLRGNIRAEGGDNDGGERYIRKALGLIRSQHGDVHPAIGSALDSLAYVLDTKGDPDQAMKLYKESLAVWAQLPGHDLDQAYALNNIGFTLQGQKRYEEAATYMRQAIDIRVEKLGAGHALTNASVYNLACIYSDWGRPKEAEPLFARAYAARLERHGADHGRTLAAKERWGLALGRLGQYERAKEMLQAVIRAYEENGWDKGEARARRRLASIEALR